MELVGAICFYNSLRDNVQIPHNVVQTLHSAEIPSSDDVYFRRMEITSVEQLKTSTVEDFTRVLCPYMAAHKLVDTLAAYFNNKRKQRTKDSLTQGGLSIGSSFNKSTKRLRVGSYQAHKQPSVEEDEEEQEEDEITPTTTTTTTTMRMRTTRRRTTRRRTTTMMRRMTVLILRYDVEIAQH